MSKTVSQVLSFWFGDLEPTGLASSEVRQRWFKKSDVFDNRIRSEFLETYEILSKNNDLFESTLEADVARIVIFDQMTRNMFRGTRRMYEADEKAVSLAERVAPSLLELPASYAHFAVMPLMHAENLDAQNKCVSLFEYLHNEAKDEAVKAAFRATTKYARDHREVIEAFGRFPHRNQLLGRENTKAEAEYLKDPNAGW